MKNFIKTLFACAVVLAMPSFVQAAAAVSADEDPTGVVAQFNATLQTAGNPTGVDALTPLDQFIKFTEFWKNTIKGQLSIYPTYFGYTDVALNAIDPRHPGEFTRPNGTSFTVHKWNIQATPVQVRDPRGSIQVQAYAIEEAGKPMQFYVVNLQSIVYWKDSDRGFVYNHETHNFEHLDFKTIEEKYGHMFYLIMMTMVPGYEGIM